MNLELAKQICTEVGAERKRWGRHAGAGQWRSEDLLDALMCVYEAGLFDSKIDKDALTKANRAKGAAEARAKRYKGQLDDLNVQYAELVIKLEEAEAQIDRHILK
ncbi:MAG: hypothetical protein ACYSW8_28995 [Planctomycetota bacterium]|jgi:hypothetical protein